MEPLTVLLLSVGVIVASLFWFIQLALAPAIPVRGKTNIPGNPVGRTWPIIGDGLVLLGVWNMEGFMSVLDKVLKSTPSKVLKVWLGPKMIILVRDADIMETLLNSPKAITKDRDFYKAFAYFSDGVFSKNGKQWAELRKRADVELPPKHMDKFHYVIATKFELLCGAVNDKVGKGVFNMIDLVKYLAVDMLLESLYGVPSDQFTKNTMNFPELSARATELIFLQMMKIEYRIGWLFKFLSGGRESRKVKECLRVMTNYIIDCRYEEYTKTGIYPGDPHFVPANYTDSILQYAKQENWKGDELNVLLDVLIAGSDTPTIVISAMCLYLAMYPEYQEQAYQEQVHVMGNSQEAPTMADLAKMPYLNMVMNETLRITGAPAFFRVLSSEVKSGGFIFPEGSSLLFVLRDIMHNPTYWEKPDEFYPDHFLPECVEKRPKGVFLPFSSGARSCAGKNYSEMSSRIGLSMLLRRFKFTTHLKYTEMTYKYMLLTESTKGYPVEAVRRNIKS